MKVVASGCTGFVGSAVLQRLISIPEVTSIVALSRRELEVKNAKVKTVVVEDFHNYKQTELDELAGAEACIWCLGSASSGMDVHMDMTMRAAEAFLKEVIPKLSQGKQFRFVYTSGFAVERDQNRTLFLLGDKRKKRGLCETRMLELEAENGPTWKSFIARPAVVSVREPTLSPILGNLYIPVGELAAAMVDAALNGSDKQFLENADMRKSGHAAIKRQHAVLQKT